MTGADEQDLATKRSLAPRQLRDDMDWDGFTAWLEADPRHRDAYDELRWPMTSPRATARHWRDEFAAEVERREPPRQPASRWPLWAGGALAASLVALAGRAAIHAARPVTYTVGDTSRTIALDDGSQRHCRARQQADRRRAASRTHWRLKAGHISTSATIPPRSLAIKAGGIEVTDIGTKFDVQVVGQSARVEVAEGRVQSRGAALATPFELAAGKQFSFDPDTSVRPWRPSRARTSAAGARAG